MTLSRGESRNAAARKFSKYPSARSTVPCYQNSFTFLYFLLPPTTTYLQSNRLNSTGRSSLINITGMSGISQYSRLAFFKNQTEEQGHQGHLKTLSTQSGLSKEGG